MPQGEQKANNFAGDNSAICGDTRIFDLFCRGASYRSGEPLRHPKTRAKSSFFASCSAAPHRLIKNAGFLAFLLKSFSYRGLFQLRRLSDIR